MPDLFDNFIGKMSSRVNGGKSRPRYGMNNQVNAGRHYNYHSSATNNTYWMAAAKKEEEAPTPKIEFAGGDEQDHWKPRKQLVASLISQPEAARSRFGLVSSAEE